MNLDAVMDEAATVLTEITGLRVFGYPEATITPPAGYVSYPQSVDFDETYGRGEDRFTDLPMVLLAGDPTQSRTRDTISAWASGDGPQSVKAHMESHTWTSCDDLTVTSCEFDVETIAGVPYLAAMFKATVVGSGED
jgi:hypothetical protein